jgi:hypothetical protein
MKLDKLREISYRVNKRVKIMKKHFYLTLLLFVAVWGFSLLEGIGNKKNSLNEYWLVASQDVDPKLTRVGEIDKQITELEGMKRGYEARARRHDDQAQRLQFQDRAVLETRRHLELAAENRAKADEVQKQIDLLNTEKAKILKG